MIPGFMHRLDAIKELEKGRMVTPHFVALHTSYACNQACKGCAYGHLHNGKYMERQKQFDVVNFFIDIGVKFFDFSGGGEPTMIPYLQELMAQIRARGAFFGLITNGTRLDKDFCEFLAREASYVRISMEASTEESYRQYKGITAGANKHWEKATTACELLAKSMDDFSIKFGVGKSLRGMEHYVDALELARDLQINKVHFKALRHEPEELELVEKRYESRILDRLEDHGYEDIDIRAWIEPTPLEDIPQCWLNPLHTVVDPDGNMHICCFHYNRHEDFHIGNLFDGPMKEAFESTWFSENHKRLIKAIDRKECHKVDCRFFRHHKDYEKTIKDGRMYQI